ncbi:MAG: hypothetical protein ABSC20_06285 [Candidatus Bathyarchaeia archaeon]|jgi:hypothetical protein
MKNKVCKNCGKWFMPKCNFQKFCTYHCQERNYFEHNKAHRREYYLIWKQQRFAKVESTLIAKPISEVQNVKNS